MNSATYAMIRVIRLPDGRQAVYAGTPRSVDALEQTPFVLAEGEEMVLTLTVHRDGKELMRALSGPLEHLLGKDPCRPAPCGG